MKWLTPFFVLQLILWGLTQGQPRVRDFHKTEQLQQEWQVVSVVSKKVSSDKNESWKPHWVYLASHTSLVVTDATHSEAQAGLLAQCLSLHPHTLEARAPPV